MTLRVEIEVHPDAGRNSGTWRVWCGDAVLVEKSKAPERDACRELYRQGKKGRLEVFNRSAQPPCISMRMGITSVALLG